MRFVSCFAADPERWSGLLIEQTNGFVYFLIKENMF